MKRLINRRPSRGTAVFLGLLPFLLLVVLYMVASDARLAENPNDKLLPSFATLGESMHRLAFEPSKRTGEIELWADTWASLRRLSQGVGTAALIGLTFGVILGALPLARAGLAPFVASLSLIPPLALLPILFIVFGLEELSKVVLIVFGIAPVIIRDLQQRVQELPREQIVKAQTLAREHLADHPAGHPAPGPAAADRRRAPVAGRRLAVPDRRRGHRRHRGARLPHLPGAPLSGDGRDPALCGLDHPARLPHGLRAQAGLPHPVSLVPRQGALGA